jgi:alkanesulfonate monooxygenase SsuD/methylene tetrahydromethanopterin reductase-like flavin-dependent oxidoreductase (luciferase family)
MLGKPAWSPRERTDRFTEFVELLDRLLRGPETSSVGRYYSADGARTYPGCVQQPRAPFAIAATGARGMRLAVAHADTWVTTGDRVTPPPIGATAGAEMVAEQMARLDDACAAAGRDPATLARLVLTGPQLDAGLGSERDFDAVVHGYAAIGVTDLVVHWPRASEPYAGDVSTFERMVGERIAADRGQAAD